MPAHLGALLTLLALSTIALSCSSSDAAPSASPSDAAPDEGGVVSCAVDPLAMAYSPGMEQPGVTGMLRIRLVRADPAPPALGTNAWVIAVTDAKGAPVTDATFTPRSDWGSWPNGVRPFMPHHGHPSSATPTITPNGDGTFTIGELQLFMPGLWQVTFHVQSGAQTDDVTFGFCVAG